MKTITAVDTKPTHFQDEVTPDVVASMPTYRKMFRAVCGMGLAKSGEEAMDLVQIGLKMQLADPDISLEDAEFRLLKERCEKNPVQWQAHFHGQVMLKLKEAETSKKE